MSKENTPASTDSEKIARLNDRLRKYGVGGRVLATIGIQGLSVDVQRKIFDAIKTFDDFSPDNDPYGERDFGMVETDNQKIFWKVDYYDKNLEYASPNPADQSVTERVMTVMLAQEY